MERIDLNPAPLQTPPLHYGLIMAHSDNFIVLTQDWCALCTLAIMVASPHLMMETIGCCSLHTGTFILVIISIRIRWYEESNPESRRINKPKLPHIRPFNLSLKTVNMYEFPNIDIDTLDQRKTQWEGHAMPCRADWTNSCLNLTFSERSPIEKGGWYRC